MFEKAKEEDLPWDAIQLTFGRSCIGEVKVASMRHLSVISGKEVCFDKLGCFSDDAPWSGTLDRPLKALPWSPAQINTRFLLYTNENQDNYQVGTAVVFGTKFHTLYVIGVTIQAF